MGAIQAVTLILLPTNCPLVLTEGAGGACTAAVRLSFESLSLSRPAFFTSVGSGICGRT